MLFQHVAGIDQRGTTVCSLKTKIWTFNGACVKASSRCKGDRGESTLLPVAPSRSRLVWVERERYIQKGGETFRLMVPLTLVPEVFPENFYSGERERAAKWRGERKPSGYLDLESHFHADDRVRMWPSGSLSLSQRKFQEKPLACSGTRVGSTWVVNIWTSFL